MGSRKLMKFNIGSCPVIIFFGILLAVCEFVFTQILYPLGFKEVFRLQTAYSSNTISNIICSLGDEGVKRYLYQFKLDFFFPVFYGMFFAALMSRLINIKKTAGLYKYLLLIPLLAAVFDEIENVLEVYILRNYKSINAGIVFISGISSTLKWIFVLLCFILVIFLSSQVLYGKIALNHKK